MKKLFKMFATILAVSVLTIGFASCANDSSDSSSSSSSAASSSSSSGSSSTTGVTIAATYKSTDGGKVKKILFYSNGDVARADSAAEALLKDGIIKKGTYTKTGDNFSDCTINITWKEAVMDPNDLTFKPLTGNNNQSITVTGGTFKETNNNKETIYTLQS